MIYSLTGTLQLSEPYQAVINCNGVGYLVKTSLNTASNLPSIGEEVTLYTHMLVREDAVELVGFVTMSELNAFKMLVSVSGVGPKSALFILSDLTSEQLALCIASSDAKSLTKAQGVGLKTAQRIVLELKDKISKEAVAAGVTGSSQNIGVMAKSQNASEAITALEVLGYSRSDATKIITTLDSDMSVEDMIKTGLKALAGKV